MEYRSTRIAVCQLECHPALTVADLNYLGEPFFPAESSLVLSSLSRNSIDLAGLQKDREQRYLEWHAQRISKVLDFLVSLDRVPDLIVFSEASIPLSLLKPIRNFAIQNRTTVFAGTHSLQLTHECGKVYKELGIKPAVHKSWGMKGWACTGVLTIFNGDQTTFHRKRVPSVFEVTDVSPLDKGNYELEPMTMEIGGSKMRVVAASAPRPSNNTPCRLHMTLQ